MAVDPKEAKKKFVDKRWTPENDPVGYIIGVTPGFSQFEQGMDKLTNMGLARKIMKAARLGFDFCQIDYEALSEMFEADIKQQIAHIKSSQGNIETGRKFEVGIHLMTDIDLCIAGSYEWKIMHERLTKGAYSARALAEAKYILFHTSSRIRPHVTFDVGQQEARHALYSFDGVNLARFMQNVDEGNYVDPLRGPVKCPTTTPSGRPIRSMQDWFMGRFISILFNAMGAPADVSSVAFFDRFMLEEMGSGFKDGDEQNKRDAKKFSDEYNERIKALRNVELMPIERQLSAAKREMYLRKANNLPTYDLEAMIDNLESQRQSLFSRSKEEVYSEAVVTSDPKFEQTLKDVQSTRAYLGRTDFKKVFEFWRRHGSEGEEQVAYRVIAKYMWLTADPLWIDIVGMKYDPDLITWNNEQGREHYRTDPNKEETEDKSGPTSKVLVEKLITAVAAKYIQGHLFVNSERWSMKMIDPDLKEHTSVYNYCKDGNIKIFIETAMPPQGQEGQLRIMSASDHIKLVKNLDGGKFTSYCLDFEHLTVNFIEVPKDLDTLAEGDAKYIRMVHINAPRPMMGAHAPIERLSRDMQIIYRWLYQMRKKGMTNAYLIWEMGSYGIAESAVAFRNLMFELAKDTDPLKLPKEFFGIDDKFEMQQWVNMREHAYDPLKGLILTSEEEHGMMSAEAVKKNKLAEWVAGRYR